MILSEYPKLGNKFISVHGVCTRGRRLNLGVLRSVVNPIKLPRHTGYPYSGLHILLFYELAQLRYHDIYYVGGEVYDTTSDFIDTELQ